MSALPKSLDADERPVAETQSAPAHVAGRPRIASDEATAAVSPARALQGDIVERLASPRRRSLRRMFGAAGLGIAATAYCAGAWVLFIRWLLDIRPGG